MISRFLEPLVLGCLLASALAFAPVAAADAPASANIQGYWNSNISIKYEIAQHGTTFIWMAKQIQERGQGTIDGTTITASWKGARGAGNGTGVIKEIDATGAAHRIEWSNGVVFTR